MSLEERLASRCAVFGSCIVRSVCSWQGTAVSELRAPSILLNKAATFYSFYFILSKYTLNSHFAVIPSVSWVGECASIHIPTVYYCQEESSNPLIK